MSQLLTQRAEHELVASVDFSMTDGGVVGKVGILRLLRGLVILQSVDIKFRPFGPPARPFRSTREVGS